MRLDGLTVSARKLLVVVATMAALILVGVINANRAPAPVAADASPAPPPSAHLPETPVLPGEPATADADPDTDGILTEGEGVPPGDGLVEDDEAVAAHEALAHQVAADFAAGYAQHHFDDAPSVALERVRPYITEELEIELARNSGATAAHQERVQREERTTATVQAVQYQGGSVAERRLDLLVVVRQDVTWKGGSEVRWPTYVIQVALVDGQWRVARVLL